MTGAGSATRTTFSIAISLTGSSAGTTSISSRIAGQTCKSHDAPTCAVLAEDQSVHDQLRWCDAFAFLLELV